jgi:hypothetical protein
LECGSNTLQNMNPVHDSNPMNLWEDGKMHNPGAMTVRKLTGDQSSIKIPFEIRLWPRCSIIRQTPKGSHDYSFISILFRHCICE